MAALEVNPWFNYYVMRDGSRSALREALSIGRSTMTTPGEPCKLCGKATWFRPLVGAYTCYDCAPGTAYVSEAPRATGHLQAKCGRRLLNAGTVRAHELRCQRCALLYAGR